MNAPFLRACRESDGEFVDVTDPSLRKRLDRPIGITADNTDDHYPPDLKEAGVTGWVDVIIVIELDGSVTSLQRKGQNPSSTRPSPSQKR
jgi:hypothetical protein